jgi:hypothetical protein
MDLCQKWTRVIQIMWSKIPWSSQTTRSMHRITTSNIALAKKIHHWNFDKYLLRAWKVFQSATPLIMHIYHAKFHHFSSSIPIWPSHSVSEPREQIVQFVASSHYLSIHSDYAELAVVAQDARIFIQASKTAPPNACPAWRCQYFLVPRRLLPKSYFSRLMNLSKFTIWAQSHQYDIYVRFGH